jgi:hypothetical protein
MRQTWTSRMGGAVILLCVGATLARAAPMVCTMTNERLQASPMAFVVRSTCVQVKGADGVEVPVNLPDVKVGERINCTVDANGKAVCQQTPYAFSGGGSVAK